MLAAVFIWLLDVVIALPPAPADLELTLALAWTGNARDGSKESVFVPTVTYTNRSKRPLRLTLAYGCNELGFHALVVDGKATPLFERWPPCRDWFAHSADRALAPGASITLPHPAISVARGAHRVLVRYTVPKRVDCPLCRETLKDDRSAVWRGTAESNTVDVTVP